MAKRCVSQFVGENQRENVGLLSLYPLEEATQNNEDDESGVSSTQLLYGVSQCQIFFSSFTIFFIMLTFFVSTSLWVYAEPVLSLYLKDTWELQDYAAPLFFFVFSSGYLVAALSMALT